MKLTTNNITVEGTPKEMLELIHLMGQQPERPVPRPFAYKPYIGTTSELRTTTDMATFTTINNTTNKGTSYEIPSRFSKPPISIFWTT